MANLKSLVKDTAIYGLSSIVGRFLNYLLVPLYTHYMPKSSGDYGISTNVYAYTALILVLLTFGMETSLFRFANDEREQPDTVFSTAFALVGSLTILFLAAVFGAIGPIAGALGYAEHPEYLEMMAAVVAMDALQALPFSYLRFQKRPLRFAALKLLFIGLNIGLNVVYFVVLGKTSVYYVFLINLLCTGLISILFLPQLARVRWHVDGALLRRMLAYSWPILVLGIAGVLNQVADKIIFPLVYPDTAEANVQLGIYGSCVKIAMIMALITQAFRYAYEPIVFAKAKDADKGEYYAVAMKYFIIFTLLAYLCVEGFMPLLQYIIGPDYREGLGVVPIVMAAEIMMGIYFNLSFWYKLIDKTIYGAWFSLAGCIVLLAVNLLLIPHYGYWACAWGGFAGYATCMVLSYAVGQRMNPIDYPLGEIFRYVLLATVLFGAMLAEQALLPSWAQLLVNTPLILLFAAYTVRREHIPVRQRLSALLPLLLAGLFLTSCGSSRKAVQPAAPYTPAPAAPVSTTPATTPATKVRTSTPEQVTAWRLDSLLTASDTLLRQTQLGLHVVDLTAGTVLYARGEQQRMRPASTEKVVTAVAALALLGPSYTLDTQLKATAPLAQGVLQGDLYVRGAMDPLMTVADVRTLASRLKAAGVQRITGRIVADASMKDGDDYGWGWCWDDKNAVLSPLLCGGRPGLAKELKTALARIGVKAGAVVAGTAPAGARELAALRRPLADVLQPMMKESDNLCAEAVFYQMGHDRRAVAARIQELVGDAATTVADGSGLSLYNYQTPQTFTRLLTYAAERPDSIYHPLLAALPVAGVDGTLKNRMKGTAAAVAVRAKTGTVTAVSTLVGYTTQRSTNHLLAFAIMNQGVRSGAQGRAFQDQVCRVLSE